MSVFLDIVPSEWVASNALAFAIRDRYPVSAGHTLVITRRVVEDWFAATPEERAAVLELVDIVKRRLDEELHPDGYNVGFNAGVAAGQTVMHLHVHIIPRYRGDIDDPRGGVRHVIPSKGNYLRDVHPLAVGGEKDPFSRHVLPLFETATEIAIVAAFVQASGLGRISRHLRAAVDRGATVRILTGDYLDITQAAALDLLLDWQESSRSAEPETDDDDSSPGSLEARIIETKTLPLRGQSFHPKSWRFETARYGIAFVGSSNLSRSALDTGIEWNLRVDRDRDTHAYECVRDEFDALWTRARALDAAWVDAYAARARRERGALPPGEVDDAGPLERAPDAHVVQREALAELRRARAAGRRRAVVVLATGLGKTLLAAYDMLQLREELALRTPRVLFVAHRRELLRQAAETYRRVMFSNEMRGRVTWFVGTDGDLSGDLVFASVAKLARPTSLAKLAKEHFDYVVIDEVHHAAARSYRSILDNIDPAFLLGLTATPDRADADDILGLFDDHVAYRADLARGVEIGKLVPFRYYGIKDEIDYENIPWRNRKFDSDVLASAAQTEARMQTLWRAWSEHPGTRTLVFCCSIAHALYVRGWLDSRGLRVAAVFSAEGSDDRDESIRALAEGRLDALCSVDVFNEGVDVPAVERVVMLRPTESSVVFLQQLGRGLRAAQGKESVTVVDFVGNHAVFLERLRALLSLGGRASPAVRDALTSTEPIELPAGCSVELSLEAKDVLSRLFHVGGADEVERVYHELYLERGERPKAGELERMGYRLSALRRRHGSWFDFVATQRHLNEDESTAIAAAGAFLRDLETTDMVKSFKMVTLESLLEAGALLEGMALRDLAQRAHAFLRRSPELFSDVAEGERFDKLDAGNEKAWLSYWRTNPIAAWTSARTGGRTWFRVDGDRFVPVFDVPSAAHAAFADLTREMVDYRLAQYRTRKRNADATAEGFICRVISNQRDPILKLPSVARDALPSGEVDVRVDGGVWQFRLMKEFCNVARPVGTQRNALPDLLRRWFGPSAGQAGTAFEVRFHATPDGYSAEPLNANVLTLGARAGITAYPDLRAAAGHGLDTEETALAERVVLPLRFTQASDDLFAVRVSGSSMDGGKSPLRDGDWAIMRLARGASSSALLQRVILVQVPAESAGMRFQIKRLVADNAGSFQLVSDNPDGPTFRATGDMTPIARLEEALHPEDLGPSVGSVLSPHEIGSAFGLDEAPMTSGRHGGHLFLCIDRKGMLEAPDLVRDESIDRRPGETAFVLAVRSDGSYRYLGVGRWLVSERAWKIGDADFDTWRLWGEGRETSRALPEGAAGRAQIMIDALLALPKEERILTQANGKTARVLGRAPRGGVRIDGGDSDRLQERTVSTTDLAWVIVAGDDVRDHGSMLGEALVNKLRYLEGTPKGSTRWIDTRWAIAAYEKMRDHVGASTSVPLGAPRRVRNDAGDVIDATFFVEVAGTDVAIVFESGGGTRGTDAAENRDYRQGLTLLLDRLARAGLQVRNIELASTSPQAAQLTAEQRQVRLPELEYPLTIRDAERVRKDIGKALASMGRKPGAKGGGNSDKRVRIVVLAPPMSATRLAELLEAASAGERRR